MVEPIIVHSYLIFYFLKFYNPIIYNLVNSIKKVVIILPSSWQRRHNHLQRWQHQLWWAQTRYLPRQSMGTGRRDGRAWFWKKKQSSVILPPSFFFFYRLTPLNKSICIYMYLIHFRLLMMSLYRWNVQINFQHVKKYCLRPFIPNSTSLYQMAIDEMKM